MAKFTGSYQDWLRDTSIEAIKKARASKESGIETYRETQSNDAGLVSPPRLTSLGGTQMPDPAGAAYSLKRRRARNDIVRKFASELVNSGLDDADFKSYLMHAGRIYDELADLAVSKVSGDDRGGVSFLGYVLGVLIGGSIGAHYGDAWSGNIAGFLAALAVDCSIPRKNDLADAAQGFAQATYNDYLKQKG